jgi:hypothetical protein
MRIQCKLTYDTVCLYGELGANNNPAMNGGVVVWVRYLSRGLIPFLTALKGGVLNPSHTRKYEIGNK